RSRRGPSGSVLAGRRSSAPPGPGRRRCVRGGGGCAPVPPRSPRPRRRTRAEAGRARGSREVQVAPDQRGQVLGLQWLDQELRGAELDAALAVVLPAFAGDDEQRCLTVVRVHLHEVDELEPVDVRHVDVGDDQIEAVAGQQLQRVEAAARADDLGALDLRKSRGDELPRRGRVLDDENLVPHSPAGPPSLAGPARAGTHREGRVGPSASSVTRAPRNAGTNASANAEVLSGAGIAPRPGSSRATLSTRARLSTSAAWERAVRSTPGRSASPPGPRPRKTSRGAPIRPFEGRRSDSPRVPRKKPSTSKRESCPHRRQSAKPAAPPSGRSSSETKRQSVSTGSGSSASSVSGTVWTDALIAAAPRPARSDRAGR